MKFVFILVRAWQVQRVNVACPSSASTYVYTYPTGTGQSRSHQTPGKWSQRRGPKGCALVVIIISSTTLILSHIIWRNSNIRSGEHGEELGITTIAVYTDRYRSNILKGIMLK